MSRPRIEPSVNPELAAQMALYQQPKILTTRDNIHTAYCYTGSNCTMIEGTDGVILVDTLSGELPGDEAAAAFKEITDKPIKAVILTHNHGDHVSGIFSFVPEDDIRSGKVDLIAHEELTGAMLRDWGLLAPIRTRRGPFQFGAHLDYGETGGYGSAIGAPPRRGKSGFIEPTTTFSDRFDLDLAGIRLQVIHVPSETDDQCVVWLPAEKVLISADAVQGMTFPNVYALRGTQFRNPMIWAKGLDTLRSLKAETLIPHHGPTVEGAENVEDVLTAYRDAIQYLHDQCVRWINQGCTWDELADKVTMPDHLKSHPWLGEFYGSFKHSVRSVYAGYVGWFQGDAVELDPHPWRERAARYVQAMGGRDSVIDQAAEALDAEDYRWAADILTWLVRSDLGDREARELKAEALRGWAYRQKNSTWRNWGLCQAMELEDKLGEQKGGHAIQSNQARNYPTGGLLEMMCCKLRAEDALDTHLTLGFVSSDTGEACGLEIRRGVCQFHDRLPEECDATLTFERAFLSKWAGGSVSFEGSIETGDVSLDGDPANVTAFFSKFETAETIGRFGMSVR